MRDIHAEYCMEREGISAEFFVCAVLRRSGDRAYHEAAVSEKATPDGFRTCAVGVRPL